VGELLQHRSTRLDRLVQADVAESSDRVRVEAEAGADLEQAVRLLEHDDVAARVLERDGCGQPPDPGADDHHSVLASHRENDLNSSPGSEVATD
jgi:hypothetical protein